MLCYIMLPMLYYYNIRNYNTNIKPIRSNFHKFYSMFNGNDTTPLLIVTKYDHANSIIILLVIIMKQWVVFHRDDKTCVISCGYFLIFIRDFEIHSSHFLFHIIISKCPYQVIELNSSTNIRIVSYGINISVFGKKQQLPATHLLKIIMDHKRIQTITHLSNGNI